MRCLWVRHGTRAEVSARSTQLSRNSCQGGLPHLTPFQPLSAIFFHILAPRCRAVTTKMLQAMTKG